MCLRDWTGSSHTRQQWQDTHNSNGGEVCVKPNDCNGGHNPVEASISIPRIATIVRQADACVSPSGRLHIGVEVQGIGWPL